MLLRTLCKFSTVFSYKLALQNTTKGDVLCSHTSGRSIGRQLLTTDTLTPPTSQGHTHYFFLSPCLSRSLSSFHVPLPPSTSNSPPHPFLSPSMHLHLHFLARFLSPSHPLLKSETARNPMRFFFGQAGGNGSERRAQVRLQLLIKNLHCPAWRDVRNDFGFDLSKLLCLTCTDLYEDIWCIYFQKRRRRRNQLQLEI